MNNQNDISKGHGYVQKDIQENTYALIALFSKPFEQSLYASVKKLEKIVSALYLVTDVMDENVPLTATLRSRSLGMLTNAFGLLRVSPLGARAALSKVLVDVEEVSALVRIGGIAYHVSRMNANILEEELQKVLTVLVDLVGQTADAQASFTGSPILPEQPIIPSDVLRDAAFEGALGQVQARRIQNDIKTTLLSSSAQKDIKETSYQFKSTFEKDTKKPQETIDRKQQIIQVLKAKQPATLADIKTLVKDLSDKTLQREMMTLVTMGLVQKEGNKRWTTYRLTK